MEVTDEGIGGPLSPDMSVRAVWAVSYAIERHAYVDRECQG